MRHFTRTPLRAQRGFTLIELMVAIGVMALLAIMSWRGLDGMTRSQTITQEHADEVLALEVGLAQWGADLDAMQQTPQTPAIQKLDWNGRVFRLTRRDTADPGAGLRVVAWTLRNVNGAGAWMRWQSEPVTTRAAWQTAWERADAWSQAAGADAPRNEVAIAPITDWQLFYFRDNAWSNPQSSAGAVNGFIDANTGPDGIRLIVTIPPGRAITGRLVRDWVKPDIGGNKS